MTGTIIRVPPGMSVEDVADGYDIAVPDGLIYLNFLSDVTTLGRNLAEGGNPATVVGAPAVSAEFATLSSSAYINTGLSRPTGDFTLIAVASIAVDNNGFILGNYEDAFHSGAWLYFNQATPADGSVQITFGTTTWDGSAYSVQSLAGSTIAADGTPRAYAARYNSTTRQKHLNNLTAGSSVNNTPANAMAGGGTSMRIGAAVGAGATLKVGLAAIWDRRLSDDELAAQYAQFKTAFAVVGVTI